mmetsp:Transcript_30690/g.68791  ORF Transcript_30690/g.68791 Transcript_30690/m.68791 type:complete len:201 (-) Transcript_30690:32-634(-)
MPVLERQQVHDGGTVPVQLADQPQEGAYHRGRRDPAAERRPEVTEPPFVLAALAYVGEAPRLARPDRVPQTALQNVQRQVEYAVGVEVERADQLGDVPHGARGRDAAVPDSDDQVVQELGVALALLGEEVELVLAVVQVGVELPQSPHRVARGRLVRLVRILLLERDRLGQHPDLLEQLKLEGCLQQRCRYQGQVVRGRA